MIPLLMVHGWAFDASFWDPMRERLTDFPIRCIDLGFSGRADRPGLRRPLVVAHSMGLAWALATVPRPWAGLLAVNAFPAFTRTASFVDGVSPRVVERMRARFGEDPRGVTAEFLARCGLPQADLSGLRAKPLGEALDWLAVCDERAALAELDCPVRALAGTADVIVPQSMSRALYARHDLYLLERAGHLLPLTHPDWVEAHLRDFAAQVAPPVALEEP